MRCAGEFSHSGFDGYYYTYSHQLLFCPVCEKPSLLEVYTDQFWQQEYEHLRHCEGVDESYAYRETLLYPPNKLETRFVPESVRTAFEEALKIRNVDPITRALVLRRALEVIMIDQGATRRYLHNKIQEIADRGILPASLTDASFLAKRFGNFAAHDNDDLALDENDIASLIEFIQYIIDYLYIIPAKIKQFQDKMNRETEPPAELPEPPVT